MMINKDTVVCISIAARPGSLGATIFNHVFGALSMNWIYKPFKVDPEQLERAITGVRALGIRGCGVSMPHKEIIMQHLDAVDEAAQKIGAVNTIVNRDGKLTGYNTDCEGVRVLTREEYDVKGKSVFIIGAGGAARAALYALQKNEAGAIAIANHHDEKARQLAEEWGIRFVPWEERDKEGAALLLNATPVGMQEGEQALFSEETIQQAEAVFDVVVSPTDTDLIDIAKKYGKQVFPGVRMSVIQALEQFKLYTETEAPMEAVEQAINSFFEQK